jgi:hypothetical protein
MVSCSPWTKMSRKAPLELVQGRLHVLLLAPAPVVLSFGEADPAEVEAQHGQPLLLQRLGRAEHGLEVHDAAVQRMRVADEGGRRRLALGLHEDGLQASGRAAQEEGFVRSHGPGETTAPGP